MPETAIVTRDDPRRSEIEGFIKRVYRSRYDARIEDFPSRLIACRGENDGVICAAGLRTAQDGFFSESYLDAPIERILGELSNRTIDRAEILEVSTLVSVAPAETCRFIARIISFGEEQSYAWSFFTLTRRLRNIVEKLGLFPICLADADPSRVVNFERWGDYYAAEPRVYAVASNRVTSGHQAFPVAGCDAIPV